MPETGTIQEIYTAPKTVEWSIINFFHLPKRVGYLIASPKFYFREYSCRLVALPNGTDSLPDIMMLTLTGIGKAGIARWELEIQRTDSTVLRKCGGFKSHNCEVEMTMLIPYKEVEIGCYARGYMKIICTLYSEDDIHRGKIDRRYKETGCQTEATSRADKLSCDLEELLISGEDNNVSIKVENKEFKVHKSILGARTPVFTSMFKHKMSESITGIVDIDDCDPNAFREFLRYLYSGRAKFVPDNVFNLYKIAHKYQVDELKEYCLEYVKNNLSVNIFCEAIALSIQYDEEEMMDIATDFLSKNMTDIMDTEKWQTFLAENPTESNKLLLDALKLQNLKKKTS